MEHFRAYGARLPIGTIGVMPPRKPESQFVRLAMPEATEAEIDEATRRWFGFLQTLDRIVTEREQAARDSRESRMDDNFEDV